MNHCGVGMRTIQKQMGHKHISTTALYCDISDEMLRTLWNCFDFGAQRVVVTSSSYSRVIPRKGTSDRRRCPLLGLKRTSLISAQMSANDPKRTFARRTIRT